MDRAALGAKKLTRTAFLWGKKAKRRALAVRGVFLDELTGGHATVSRQAHNFIRVKRNRFEVTALQAPIARVMESVASLKFEATLKGIIGKVNVRQGTGLQRLVFLLDAGVQLQLELKILMLKHALIQLDLSVAPFHGVALTFDVGREELHLYVRATVFR